MGEKAIFQGSLMNQVNPVAPMVETFYWIAPHTFHFLKSILEGYDNLAIISAVEPDTGLIRIRCAETELQELMELLTRLAPVIRKDQLT
ncbi:MAG: DUF4911 domain-containing protein [Desulfofustis sp. PB-SRB1]|nr:DUF4911 domain-containing protein [Desulfofustis sp. PB-SRB1]